jgi:hypothetical protein
MLIRSRLFFCFVSVSLLRDHLSLSPLLLQCTLLFVCVCLFVWVAFFGVLIGVVWAQF